MINESHHIVGDSENNCHVAINENLICVYNAIYLS